MRYFTIWTVFLQIRLCILVTAAVSTLSTCILSLFHTFLAWLTITKLLWMWLFKDVSMMTPNQSKSHWTIVVKVGPTISFFFFFWQIPKNRSEFNRKNHRFDPWCEATFFPPYFFFFLEFLYQLFAASLLHFLSRSMISIFFLGSPQEHAL